MKKQLYLFTVWAVYSLISWREEEKRNCFRDLAIPRQCPRQDFRIWCRSYVIDCFKITGADSNKMPKITGAKHYVTNKGPARYIKKISKQVMIYLRVKFLFYQVDYWRSTQIFPSPLDSGYNSGATSVVQDRQDIMEKPYPPGYTKKDVDGKLYILSRI